MVISELYQCECTDPFLQVRTELSTILPRLRTEPFARILTFVFIFYVLVSLLSVLLIVFSIWL